MPANDSWQKQGRQQHGWFGSGTSPHDIHRVADPHYPADHEPALGHVYPVEYLLSLLTAGAGRVLLSAALRNMGWREPTPAKPPEPRGPNLEIEQGKQDKHIPGTNNYVEGRSILLTDGRDLVRRYAGRGVQREPVPVGEPGSVEAFDTQMRLLVFGRTRLDGFPRQRQGRSAMPKAVPT